MGLVRVIISIFDVYFFNQLMTVMFKQILLSSTLIFIFILFLVNGCKNKDPEPNVPSQNEPLIESIAPFAGIIGDEVAINGSNFKFGDELVTVEFNGTQAIIIEHSDTKLVVTVPNGAITGKIKITVGIMSVVSEIEFIILEQSPNTWTNNAFTIYDGIPKSGIGFTFVIDGKAYVGGAGQDNNNDNIKDFWEFDPATNKWTQKADFPGDPRNNAAGFVIGSIGYMGTGYNGTLGTIDDNFKKDFWKYDPSKNEWTQLNDFKGSGRDGATAFSIGGKGYLGLGEKNLNYFTDFWEYDPVSDDWIEKTSYKGIAKSIATVFMINEKAYVGVGQSENGNSYDFWEYDPISNDWTEKASYPVENPKPHSFFVIGTKGYAVSKELWVYDAVNNEWVEKTAPPVFNYSTTSFAIAPYGYMGMGTIPGENKKSDQFYRYLPD